MYAGGGWVREVELEKLEGSFVKRSLKERRETKAKERKERRKGKREGGHRLELYGDRDHDRDG